MSQHPISANIKFFAISVARGRRTKKRGGGGVFALALGNAAGCRENISAPWRLSIPRQAVRLCLWADVFGRTRMSSS